MGPTVWTNRRKWLGNVVPALFWLPFAIAGVVAIVVTGTFVGIGLALIAAGTVVGWLAVNQFGFFENARMRRQLGLMLDAKGEPYRDAPFVGMATPRYSSMLDPHEEVGFLRLLPDRLSFISENRTVDLERSQVKSVRFRANVHTLIGLGRWISVEADVAGSPLRLLIEPREKGTLLGNLRYSTILAQTIRRWASEA